MAETDTSLDDFFAKKDKTKKKGKSKVTPDELMEKRKIKKKKAPSDKKKEEGSGAEHIEVDSSKMKGVEDEEWLDVKEEEKDYSGLRIQTLQIQQEKEEEEKETESKTSDDEGSESGEKKDAGSSGPWAKIDTPAPPVVQKPPTPEPERKEETPAKPQKYVPPGARQAAAAQAHSIGPGMGPTSRRGRKTAPNLQSEEDFPTLGGDHVPVVDSAWGAGGTNFERVKSGGKQLDDSANKGPQLNLGNKYTALQGGTE